MTETVKPAAVITVQGEHTAMYTPDLAVLAINVNFDGADRNTVFNDARSVAEDLRGHIAALHHASTGPIVRWSSDSVRLWGDRPWNSDGKRMPLVYHSVIDFSTTFNDFDALARFIEVVAEIRGVTIGNLRWELEHDNLRTATNDVRLLAVQDAVAKATAFAGAIGCDTVKATAIADPGMLGDHSSSSISGYTLASARGLMKSGGGAPELSLKPEDVDVTVVVDARFDAR